MPSFRHHELGDLYVRINVNFPSSLDPSIIPMLEQALPKRKEMQKFGKKYHLDEVTLEEPSDRQKRNVGGGEEMDEDDEDGQGGHGVQCAQRECWVSSTTGGVTDYFTE
jgi:DnaJ family protein A protein 2